MRKIKLVNSEAYTIVDDEDFDFLSIIRWREHVNGYVYGSYEGKQVYMHRFVNNTPKGMQTDHINRDKKDNRKENLRTCTGYQNQANAIRSNNTTGFRGVTRDKRRKNKPYQAKIRVNGKQKCIGMFDTAEEAAKEYNLWAYIYHGKFAVFNKV